MTTYKYADPSASVVHIIDDDGVSRGSCLVSAVPAGKSILPADPPSPEAVQSALTAAVQAHLDATARTHGYDGILSACTYATDTHPPFQAEGQACVSWRGAVWSTCYQIMAEVQSGTRAVPTEAELLALLPVMVWP